MAAKEIVYTESARNLILSGVNALADADLLIDRMLEPAPPAGFIARAPEEIVEENRERLAGYQAEMARLDAALARIG